MIFQLPDDSTPFGKSVRRRVHEEYLMWLTTVDMHDMPQPAPIWFWWDEAASNFLIYNQTHAKRLDFVRRNSQVALHLMATGLVLVSLCLPGTPRSASLNLLPINISSIWRNIATG